MTDQEKRTAINTATINFAKSVRDNAINKVIDVIQAAGSSAATETTELATGLQISLNPSTVSVKQLNTETVTVSVTSTNNGTYYLTLTGAASTFAELNGNIITLAPSNSINAGNYTLNVVASSGAEVVTATLNVEVSSAGTAPIIKDPT